MADFIYPNNMEIREIAQDLLPRLQEDRVIFDLMPIVETNADLIMWRQRDNFEGLQQFRGMNGKPGRVNRIGANEYIVKPGYYGEWEAILEDELTRRAALAPLGQPVDIADLVLECQTHLMERELDVIEYIGWQLLLNGTFSVADGAGVVMHTDTFSVQTYSAAVTWSTTATAAPLKDLRAMKLLHRGHSVSFGRESSLYMNQNWVNQALNNANANDLGGKRLQYGSNVLTIEQFNQILMENDLPTIVPYDEGYFDESGTFHLFIPDAEAVLVGKRRDGSPVANYHLTRNAQNPNCAPGAYSFVKDTIDDNEPPREIIVHRGHNGGPSIPYPSAVVSAAL
jgi:hypothetical protein